MKTRWLLRDTSPIFDEITINLNSTYYNGENFKIICNNNSVENKYIQSAELNGQTWNKCRFPHAVLSNGGTLVLTLDKTPNKQWGVE